jgi:hypothetical protein
LRKSNDIRVTTITNCLLSYRIAVAFLRQQAQSLYFSPKKALTESRISR